MKKLVVLLFIIGFTPCFSQTRETIKRFEQEVAQLKEFYHIPGLALLVKKGDQIIHQQYLGYSDIETKIPVDSTSMFPIASLTKPFASVLLLQLAEEKKISLDDPIAKYIENSSFPANVQIKHILSHTSQGEVGKNFYYSSRFSLLSQVIQKASGLSFAQLLESKILAPLQLHHTFLLADSSSVKPYGERLVKGYLFEEETKKGFYDYGYSTAAGIVSNLHDLAKFDNALDNNVLISEKSKGLLFTPYLLSSPYGLGIFSQPLLNKNIIWGYGQFDCFASLFLKVPEENLTLIIMANNNLMSDAARLIYGDITTSLFALSFLKSYVFDSFPMPSLENDQSITAIKPQKINKLSADNRILFRQMLLAQALSCSFMGQTGEKEMERSRVILQKTFSLFPDVRAYGTLSLMHNLLMLKTIGKVDVFDKEFLAIGESLLAQDKENPYANFYLGTFYDMSNNKEKAIYHFKNIVDAQNFNSNWYTNHAAAYLKKVKVKK